MRCFSWLLVMLTADCAHRQYLQEGCLSNCTAAASQLRHTTAWLPCACRSSELPNFIASTKFFACLDLSESQELLEQARVITVQPNETLFEVEHSWAGIWRLGATLHRTIVPCCAQCSRLSCFGKLPILSQICQQKDCVLLMCFLGSWEMQSTAGWGSCCCPAVLALLLSCFAGHLHGCCSVVMTAAQASSLCWRGAWVCTCLTTSSCCTPTRSCRESPLETWMS